MVRKNIYLLFVLIFFLALAGCSLVLAPASATPPPPVEVQITEQGGACGSGVGLNAGDILVLVLEGNPSAGFTWEVGFFVPEVIKPAGEPEYQAGSAELGAAGTYTFRFLAVGKGQASLQMVYHKPWEQGVPDLKTCAVDVKVE